MKKTKVEGKSLQVVYKIRQEIEEKQQPLEIYRREKENNRKRKYNVKQKLNDKSEASERQS